MPSLNLVDYDKLDPVPYQSIVTLEDEGPYRKRGEGRRRRRKERGQRPRTKIGIEGLKIDNLQPRSCW